MLENLAQSVLVEAVPERLKSEKTKEFSVSGSSQAYRFVGKTVLGLFALEAAIFYPDIDIYAKVPALIPVGTVFVADWAYFINNFFRGNVESRKKYFYRGHILTEIVDKIVSKYTPSATRSGESS